MVDYSIMTNTKKSAHFRVDLLGARVYGDREELGKSAAHYVAEQIRRLFGVEEHVRMVFAAAPSQNEFLKYLSQEKIDWQRISAFHMDEYLGLESGASQRFGNFLKERLFDVVPFGSVYYIDSEAGDRRAECKRYAELLQKKPIDIVCLGIGENGHIAFNDPPVADFNDPEAVKVVELDEVCRQQQVNDGCFTSITEVPTQAITLTIPVLMSAQFLSVVVPGRTKADAVEKTVRGPISEECPASVIRTHPNAILFLDKDSASKIV
jgi:glucosamine-6-phosphate deaminase